MYFLVSDATRYKTNAFQLLPMLVNVKPMLSYASYAKQSKTNAVLVSYAKHCKQTFSLYAIQSLVTPMFLLLAPVQHTAQPMFWFVLPMQNIVFSIWRAFVFEHIRENNYDRFISQCL